MTGTPPPPGARNSRGRWVAIVTGAISVLVGVIYLLVIAVLDSRGPLQPPPPEALGLAPHASAPPSISAVRDGGEDAARAVPADAPPD